MKLRLLFICFLCIAVCGDKNVSSQRTISSVLRFFNPFYWYFRPTTNTVTKHEEVTTTASQTEPPEKRSEEDTTDLFTQEPAAVSQETQSFTSATSSSSSLPSSPISSLTSVLSPPLQVIAIPVKTHSINVDNNNNEYKPFTPSMTLPIPLQVFPLKASPSHSLIETVAPQESRQEVVTSLPQVSDEVATDSILESVSEGVTTKIPQISTEITSELEAITEESIQETPKESVTQKLQDEVTTKMSELVTETVTPGFITERQADFMEGKETVTERSKAETATSSVTTLKITSSKDDPSDNIISESTTKSTTSSFSPIPIYIPEKHLSPYFKEPQFMYESEFANYLNRFYYSDPKALSEISLIGRKIQ